MKIKYIKRIYINVIIKEAVVYINRRNKKKKFILLYMYIMLFKRVRREYVIIIL